VIYQSYRLVIKMVTSIFQQALSNCSPLLSSLVSLIHSIPQPAAQVTDL
jgi:hypothetical protein